MLTSIFLVFIGGWGVWFWIDKPPAGQFGLPPPGESMVVNFQRSVDLLKAGYPDMAYLYIWHAHYLILSVVFGMLLAVIFRSLSGHLARSSRRRLYHPLPGAGLPRAGSNPAPERAMPASGDEKTPEKHSSNGQAEQ